ncbi:flagellar biosynthetic protein FlhB [Quadrisphaera granulorum]|uniref:Flagellar biosynthetic protein FlhB n=1 Tax=Quadrisphaera granulorum TaxID=317664 RepID=A0A316A3M4_9ACTN|nr:EscU/YscU/HrcU family type III secretion system export apparatus switch protein [Quadrisphaera granulorum]PWJ52576.1 flagellar biosynthetic protein FlhB [Quadrisphaera granulorum]SZE97626.1 flagellar biosynthetic protein FlhB [Quadrisphaera granulorum]
MSEGGQEKTEAPTGKRLAEARKKGQSAKTPDLGAWLGLAGAVMTVPMALSAGREHLMPLFGLLDTVAADPEPARVMQALALAGGAIVPMLAPLAVVTVIIAIASGAAQGGMHLATQAAKPNWKRLDVIKGIKQMVSPQQLWQMAKSLLKTVVIGTVLWMSIKAVLPVLLTSDMMPLANILSTVQGSAVSLIRTAVIAGLVLAVVDYAVAKRKNLKELRMTRQEVKDEMKSSEGNPLIKGTIRAKQRQMSRNRMMADVATADVVMVNPTHVAVALRYDAERGAPRVVAKGAGFVAAKIREKAAEHGVPMVADIPLARALHSACEVDQEVPPHLYVAVAQVLAFVMALRQRGSVKGVHTSPVTNALPVPV